MRTGGWRRAFCTSVQEDSEGSTLPPPPSEQQQPPAMMREEEERQRRAPSPRNCSKLSFFSGAGGSNPSTPRLAAAAGIRRRTRPKSPGGPRLQCDTPSVAVDPASSNATPDGSAAAAPSSPRSPSKFAFFKHHSRSRCRICSQSLKASQDAAVFTAECSHDFHLPCIAAHVKSRGTLACPVCFAAWSQLPSIPAVHRQEEEAATAAVEQRMSRETENRNPNRRTGNATAVAAKVYDDDEPLLLVSSTNHGGALRFKPIPEGAEEDKDDEYRDQNLEEDLEREDELHGLLANSASRCRSCAAYGGTSHWPPTSSSTGGIQVSLMPQAALLSEGRKHRNYVVVLKVKAPPMRPAHLLGRASGRAPIDLVMVLDVSQGMTGEKPQTLKRSMRLVISSLGPADRLSMVAFSATAGAKRLLPLRRMSRHGQRAALQIVERLVTVGSAAAAAATGGATVGDALRKATKVLEDRRERNPVATIMLLPEDTKQQQQRKEGEKKDDDGDINRRRHHKAICSPRDSGDGASTPRFSHLGIPVVVPASEGAKPSPKYGQVPSDDAVIKCIDGLVSMVLQDVHIQLAFPSGEISTVYSSAGSCVGSCKDVELRGGCCTIRLGYLHAEEEREILVELRVPSSSLSPPAVATSPNGCHHHLSVKCNYKDPATQAVTFGEEQLLLLPSLLPHHAAPDRAAPSSSAGSGTSLRLRNLFISNRAVAESRRLAELSDYSTAHRLLSSARALLEQSPDYDAPDRHHLVRSLDAELAELQWRQRHPQPDAPSSVRNRRRGPEHPAAASDARGEPLTPTSAWRAAEQLAKVAIMRKSLNRVGDLHGLENARF